MAKRKKKISVKVPVDYSKEPSWDNLFTNDESNRHMGNAFNWYNSNFSNKEAIGFYIDYLKSDKQLKKLIPFVKVVDEWMIGPTYGFLARMMTLGFEPPEHTQKQFDKRLAEVVEHGKKLLSQKKKVAKLNKHAPSIQELVSEQTGKLIGEIEREVDLFLENGKSDFSLYTWFQKKEVKGMYARKIRDYFQPALDEINEAILGKDIQLKEGYAFLSKAKKKKYSEFLASLVNDADAWTNVASTKRKPRKRKTRSAREKTTKVIYKIKDDKYKVASILPENMIGATQVWLFNTKDRFLHRYVSSGGITVKGTTLYDWDEGESYKKKLRKPEAVLSDVLNGGKIKLRKVMSEIESKEAPVKGRVNKDMIILKVITK